jgi:dTDP-4-amino-4,6-dideoxygalactose transaminase
MLSLFRNLGFDINVFPQAYNNFKQEISLPIYPQLTKNHVEYIGNAVAQAVEKIMNATKC